MEGALDVRGAGWVLAGEGGYARKVGYLSGLPGVRRVIETHMAHVFLTDRLAYKMKKPVQLGYSDCRTLEARQRACAAEVRLNRDLAAEVYLGVLPLVAGRGGLSLGGEGDAVDWLVQMRRLPEEQMLEAMIAAGTGPTVAQVEALAGMLARFYRRQAGVAPPHGIYLAHLQREQAINAAHLAEMARHLPDPGAVAVADQVTAQLRAASEEIAERDRSGMVVEGHGDLRPEHVCLTDRRWCSTGWNRRWSCGSSMSLTRRCIWRRNARFSERRGSVAPWPRRCARRGSRHHRPRCCGPSFCSGW